MEGNIDRVELMNNDGMTEITLNGRIPFCIIWKDDRSIYLFDDSIPEVAA